MATNQKRSTKSEAEKRRLAAIHAILNAQNKRLSKNRSALARFNHAHPTRGEHVTERRQLAMRVSATEAKIEYAKHMLGLTSKGFIPTKDEVVLFHGTPDTKSVKRKGVRTTLGKTYLTPDVRIAEIYAARRKGGAVFAVKVKKKDIKRGTKEVYRLGKRNDKWDNRVYVNPPFSSRYGREFIVNKPIPRNKKRYYKKGPL